MTGVFERKDRRVLPNWRSFELTVNFGELNNWKTEKRDQPSHSLSIEDYLFSWEQNKTIPVAGDLLSAAFVNGFTENPVVKEAALFILSSKRGNSTYSLWNLAEIIVNPTVNIPEKKFVLNKIEDCIKSDYIHKLIRELKDKIDKYPLNPILYVELSRLYSILGNQEKALRNMSIALHLAPENRFILRAASRLYTHFDLTDYIHDIIRRSELVNYDPWITSTEIALATIMGRSSRFVKRGLQMIKSGKYSPYSLTELASSIGTLEFFNGNRKKTKKLFEMALISPNDNSLAQAEWVSNEVYWFEIDPANYRVENKYEALALENYHNNRWDEALKNSVDWFCDLPFSKRPVMLGWHIANVFLDKPEIGRDLLNVGLVSHPNNAQILNNFAYSLALENKLDEAENYLARVRNLSNVNQITRICLTATKGLISFRKGLQNEGRDLYLRAIKETKVIKNNYLNQLAVLNYAREEILSESDYVDPIIDIVDMIPNDTKYPDVAKLKSVVIELYERMKSKNLRK